MIKKRKREIEEYVMDERLYYDLDGYMCYPCKLRISHHSGTDVAIDEYEYKKLLAWFKEGLDLYMRVVKERE